MERKARNKIQFIHVHILVGLSANTQGVHNSAPSFITTVPTDAALETRILHILNIIITISDSYDYEDKYSMHF